MEEELRSGIETLKDIAEGAVPPEISIEEAKAILKRYKELEEENKASKEAINTLTNKLEKVVDENKTLTDEYMIQKYLINADFLKDYIPISVIQNELDWYKGYVGTVLYEKYNYGELISVLQKILEKGNK